MEAQSSTLVAATPDTSASAPRASRVSIVAWLEAVWDSCVSRRFAWASTRCAPLVETVELDDRDVYRLLSGVFVRRTWAGSYSILVDLPAIDASALLVTITEGRLVFEIREGSHMPCLKHGRRSYSFVLPNDCDPTTLEAEVGDQSLLLVGRTIGRPTRGTLPPPAPIRTLRPRWSAA